MGVIGVLCRPERSEGSVGVMRRALSSPLATSFLVPDVIVRPTSAEDTFFAAAQNENAAQALARHVHGLAAGNALDDEGGALVNQDGHGSSQ